MKCRGHSPTSSTPGRSATGKDGGPVEVEDATEKIIAETDKIAERLFETYGRPAWIAQSTYIVVRAHLPRGFWNSGGGIEFPLQLLAGSLLVVATGPGAIAIDPALGVDLGIWWRAVSLVVAVVGALVAMAITRPRPQANPPTASASR